MITANWTEWVSSKAWCAGDVTVTPAAPRALRDVFWLAGHEDVDVRRLIGIVAQDPVLTVRVLRLANVAAFAAAGEVRSIEIAVVRLGTRAVRHAVLAACFTTWALTLQARTGRAALSEVQHAVGTACLARRLAVRLHHDDDEAFVGGLLHDVGNLVLPALRGQYLRLGGQPPSRDECETASARLHAEVGATALQLWGIPEPVREPVRWHHDPLNAGIYAQRAALVHIADRLSHRYGFGRRPPGTDDDSLQADPTAAALGLEEAWLERLDQEALDLGVTAADLVS